MGKADALAAETGTVYVQGVKEVNMCAKEKK
jgi:hypothetical protein